MDKEEQGGGSLRTARLTAEPGNVVRRVRDRPASAFGRLARCFSGRGGVLCVPHSGTGVAGCLSERKWASASTSVHSGEQTETREPQGPDASERSGQGRAEIARTHRTLAAKAKIDDLFFTTLKSLVFGRVKKIKKIGRRVPGRRGVPLAHSSAQGCAQ